MTVGLLALQGAFLDHIPILSRLNADTRLVRSEEELSGIDRLILPGGESTVMAKYLVAGMVDPLKCFIKQGLPVWGICAGCILLSECVDGRPGTLACLPMAVTRNADGRQCASRIDPIDIPSFNRTDFPAIFIRAPKVTAVDRSVKVLARRGQDPVFVQKGLVMATTFHPELTDDPVFHEHFLTL